MDHLLNEKSQRVDTYTYQIDLAAFGLRPQFIGSHYAHVVFTNATFSEVQLAPDDIRPELGRGYWQLMAAINTQIREIEDRYEVTSRLRAARAHVDSDEHSTSVTAPAR